MGMFQSGLGRLLKTGVMGTEYMAVEEERKRADAELERMRELSQRAAALFSPMAGAMRQAPVANDDGEDMSAAFGPQRERGPTRNRSPQEMAQEMAQLAGMGLNVKPYTDLAAFAKPEYTNFDGQITDKATGEILREIPGIEKGQRRVYDEKGNVVGVMDLAGAIQSIAGRKEAETLGASRGTLREVGDGRGGTRLMTGRDFMDGRGGANPELGYTPPAAELSADRIVAEDRATGQVALPGAVQTANETLALIEELKNHPGRKLGTGATGIFPGIPGNPQNDFVALLDQAKGKAFLEAFSSLKGGGAISEREGQAATAAIARLNRTQSEEGFVKALDDLATIVRTGQARQEQRAGGQSAPRPSVSPGRAALEAEARRRGLIK